MLWLRCMTSVLLVSDPFKASPLLARQILEVPSATGNPGVLRRNQPKETNGDKHIHKTWIPWSLRSDDRCGNMPYQTKSTENIDVVYLRRSLNSSKHGMPSCAHSSLGPTSHWRFYLGSRDVQLFTPVAMLNSFLKTRPFLAQNTSIQRITVNPRCVTMHTLEGQTQNTQDTRGYALPRLGFASS